MSSVTTPTETSGEEQATAADRTPTLWTVAAWPAAPACGGLGRAGDGLQRPQAVDISHLGNFAVADELPVDPAVPCAWARDLARVRLHQPRHSWQS